jgi:RimJ/RimL family protein N-acetyltransferase
MIEFNNALHGHAIAAEAGTNFNPKCDISIARTENGLLLGGVIFSGYTGVSIGIHVAGFRADWINRDMLWVTFDYPFNQLGVKKIFGQVASNNLKALEFNRKLGFTVEVTVKDVFPDADCVVMSLTRENCRGLRVRPRTLGGVTNGRQVEGSSAA